MLLGWLLFSQQDIAVKTLRAVSLIECNAGIRVFSAAMHRAGG
jgi:hypothetical protein